MSTKMDSIHEIGTVLTGTGRERQSGDSNPMVEDGGDLAMMGFTDIHMDDSEYSDAAQDFAEPAAEEEEIPTRPASDGTNVEARRSLRHQPDVFELRPTASRHNNSNSRRRRRASDSGDLSMAPQSMMMDDTFRQRERLMQREIDQLSTRAQRLADQNDILDGRNDLLKRQMDDMKRKMPSTLEDVVDKDAGSLDDAYTKLQHENRILKEQLQDAQSHIFSLQPYRKELTPDEVGREYDDLVENVIDWVSEWMSDHTEDLLKGSEDVTSFARKQSNDCNRFKKALHSNPDLLHGSQYPETDEDICVALILRFLNDNIFQKTCYGYISHIVEPLGILETQMQTSVEPKRDLFYVRTWSSEAYNAIFSSHQFAATRNKAREKLRDHLTSVFRIFCHKSRHDWLASGFETHCIIPAMQLYEKLAVSVHHYYLDINPFIVYSSPATTGAPSELESSPEFIDSVRDLSLKNLLRHRRQFHPDRIDPVPDKQALYQGLTNVCTLTPALYMRRIGRRDSIKEPVLVRRQQVLVLWGDDDSKREFVEAGQVTRTGHRTIAAMVYGLKSERSTVDSWLPWHS